MSPVPGFLLTSATANAVDSSFKLGVVLPVLATFHNEYPKLYQDTPLRAGTSSTSRC